MKRRPPNASPPDPQSEALPPGVVRIAAPLADYMERLAQRANGEPPETPQGRRPKVDGPKGGAE
jgi:hypothetical protein